MDIITTHINADFDALGSMIAAKKIYPEAVLVFPGSQEKGLRRFFMESVFYAVTFEKMGKIDLDEVKRLILVDIRQKDRIGKFDKLIDNPNVEVHVYDHHPSTDQDIQAAVEVYRPYGATVSILVELIRERSLPLTPEEATILMLGIYEDTGSLTFSSTTTNDFEAASYLLKIGADLNTVSNLITPELTLDHIELLNELIKTRKTYSYHGIDVNVAEANTDGYVGDLAVLAHKLKDMENLDVLFILARMENRVFLIARSRIPEVDVGEIVRDFGGGGHPAAASATVKDLTMFQVRERLFGLLAEHIKQSNVQKTVHDHMSFPVKSMPSEGTVSQAAEIMNRYNINGLPILEGDHLCGLVTRQVIEKVVYHGYKDHKVRKFMTTDFITLTPDAPLKEAQDILLSSTQRFIPVVVREQLVGILTRMDILQSLSSSLPSPFRQLSADEDTPLRPQKNITRLMKEHLPGKAFKRLREIGRIADKLEMKAYLVGGVVRDFLLHRKNLDIDIVIEGDGLKFAEKICQRYNAKARMHIRFGTAQIIYPDDFRIDIATARLEYYEKPAALPNVEWSSLKLDLYRRDFTMNTLAVRLNPTGFGELVDYFGGQKDIKDKVIRVIQNLSFIEDPTRIFRALRFSERFGFTLGQQTKYLLKNALRLDLPHKLDGRRLFSEIRLILKEENPIPILERIQEYGLLSAIHPELELNSKLEIIMGNAKEVASWFHLLYLDIQWDEWIFYLLCMLAFLEEEAVENVQKRLAVDSKKALRALSSKREGDKILRTLAVGSNKLSSSSIFRILEPQSMEILLYMMTKTSREKSRKAISVYITKLRTVKISLAGQDLMEMGYSPGPLFKEIMTKVLDAKLDGKVTDRDNERQWVLKHFPLKNYKTKKV